MKFGRAIVAGVIGAVLVYAVVYLAGLTSGTHADLCLLLGASITGASSVPSWLIGAIGQLLVAVVAALVYAAIFEWVTRRAGALVGFVVGLAHVVCAGIATGFLPAQRLIDANLGVPGAFLEYRGLIVLIAFVVAHLLFGTLAGAMYGRPRHAVVDPKVVWREVPIQS